MMIIYPRPLLPKGCSNRPAGFGRTTLPAAWFCSWRGLPCHPCYQWCGGLLPHHFTLTGKPAVSFLWCSL